MDSNATGRAYDQVARAWQENTSPEYGMPQLARAVAFTKNRGAALDIGCGSRGPTLGEMLAHGFMPEGIDVSAEMIALARERHPAIPVHVADIGAWPLPKTYDLIVAWDSIWHLPLAEQEPVMRKIGAALAPGGVFLFTTIAFDSPTETTAMSCWNIDLPYSALGLPRLLALLAECGCACCHLEYDQYPEQHVVVIAQKS